MAVKLSVINFKGGVGKTTLSFHLAAYLSNFGRTLLVDIDHQSSLSIVLLSAPKWEALVKSGNTINRLFESFCNRKVSNPGSAIVVENAFGYATNGTSTAFPNLDFVCSQFELDDTEIDLASTNFGNINVSDWEKRTLISSWLDAIGAEEKYDYIIFDCPPATKIVSQNALAASDFFVIPVIPDDISSRGVTHFRNLVTKKIDGRLSYLRETARIPEADIPKNFVDETKLAAIVPSLAKIAHNSSSGLINVHTEQIASLRRRWKKNVTDTVIKNLAGVTEAMNAGWPVWNYDSRNIGSEVRDMMTNVCQEIKDRIDP
ncbi:AAA family ATPase [Azospirillum sp. 11R-A]|uniref:ParA family protein n=1 Tax=Azospirillum sp. 11R-A TaxID=3111634 RepID=UPI003C270FAA